MVIRHMTVGGGGGGCPTPPTRLSTFEKQNFASKFFVLVKRRITILVFFRKVSCGYSYMGSFGIILPPRA